VSIDLPNPISSYYQDDLRDGSAASEYFTEDAVVHDEGNTYRGRKAIHEWKTGASKRYNYTVEPFALEEVEGKTVVTAHVVGNFPGSPVDLRFFFGLRGDKIASLEIKP
jgi:SnoaL-like domain